MEQAPSTVLDLFNKNEKELSPKELSELKELKKASGLYRELYDGAMKAAEPSDKNLSQEAAVADKQKAMNREVKKEAAQVDFSRYNDSDLERAIDIASAYEQQLSAYSKRAEAGYESNKDNASVRDQWEKHIQEADKRSRASESIIQALMAEQLKREMQTAPAEARAIPSTAELAQQELANIEARKQEQPLTVRGEPVASLETLAKDEITRADAKNQEKVQENAGWPTAEKIQAQMNKDSVAFKQPKFDIDVVEPDLKQWDKEAKAGAGWPTAREIQNQMNSEEMFADEVAEQRAGWPTAEAIQEQMKKDSVKFKEVVQPIEDINILEAKSDNDIDVSSDAPNLKQWTKESQDKAGWPTAEEIQKQMRKDSTPLSVDVDISDFGSKEKAAADLTAEEKAWMANGEKPKVPDTTIDTFQDVVDAPMPKEKDVIYDDEAMKPDTVENIRDLMGAAIISEKEADQALDKLNSGNEKEKKEARATLKNALAAAREVKRVSWKLFGAVSDVLRDSAVFAAKMGMKAAGK